MSMINKICVICGKEFFVYPSRIRTLINGEQLPKFCSMKCRNNSYSVNPPSKGKHHTEEAKKKISESKKGKPSWAKGKKFPDKTGDNNNARKPEAREKISRALKGRKKPYMVELNKNPILKEKRRLGKVGMKYKVSEEGRRKQGVSGKRNLEAYISKNGNPSKTDSMREKQRRRNLARWADPNFVNHRIVLARGYESQKHYDLKEKAKNKLEADGFNVTLEKPLTLNNNFYVVDVYAEKAEKKLIVECGYCHKNKLNDLRIKYEVIHIPYGELVEY